VEIGAKPGEKLYEELISEEDRFKAFNAHMGCLG